MSEFYRRRQPQTSSFTPLQEAYSAEHEADQQVRALADQQDIIGQQQREAKTQATALKSQQVEAARISARQVKAAKSQGVETITDPTTGAEDIRRDDAGKPVWNAGFLSSPSALTDDNGQGYNGVPYRDPTGAVHRVPLTNIQRTEDPTGAFYEFDIKGADGQNQRIRRPEESGKSLFKVDPTTGTRYAESADPTTGGVLRQNLGPDPVAANTAALKNLQTKQALDLEQKKFNSDELRLKQALIETEARPIKAQFTTAEKALKELEKGKRFEQRPDGLYSVEEIAGQPTSIRVEDPQTIANGQTWIKTHAGAKGAYDKFKADLDPREKQIQDMQVERDKLAIQTLQDTQRNRVMGHKLEQAAKAGAQIWTPEWQKRIEAAQADPQINRILTAAQLTDEGSPLAADVERAGVPIVPDFSGALPVPQVPYRPQVKQPGVKAPMRDDAQLLSSVMAGMPGGMKLPDGTHIATTAAAIGITDPTAFSIAPNENGTPELLHNKTGESMGYLDAKNNRLILSPGAVYGTQEGKDLADKATALTAPVYMLSGGAPMSAQQKRDYITAGTRAAMDQDTAAMQATGTDMSGIRRQVREGRLSIQEGRALMETFHNVKGRDISTPTLTRDVQSYVAGSKIESAFWSGKEATPETRAQVIDRFMDSTAREAQGNLLYDGTQLEKARSALKGQFAAKSTAAKVGAWAADTATMLAGSLTGLGVQLAANAGEALAEGVTLGEYRTSERGKLFAANTMEWFQQAEGLHNRVMGGNAQLTAKLGELRNWAASADPGDTPPADLVSDLAKHTYESYHQFETDAESKERMTSADTFNVTKDPTLAKHLARYLETRNPAELESMGRLMTMDTASRALADRSMAYITKPRAATTADVRERANAGGLNLNDEQAQRLMDAIKSKPKDAAAAKATLAQMSGMLGVSKEDTMLAMDLFTGDASTEQDSFVGYFRGAMQSSAQESLTELASTAISFGGAKLAAKGILSAARGATVATTRRVAAASWVTSQAASFADDFAKLGMFSARFGQPLTKLQRLSNATASLSKGVAVSSASEAVEESTMALGEAGSDIDTIAAAGLQGALAAPFMVGGMTVLALPFEVRARSRTSRDWEETKKTYLQKVNDRLKNIPGTEAFTPEEFEQAIALYGSGQSVAVSEKLNTAFEELRSAQADALQLPQPSVDRETAIRGRLAEIEAKSGPRDETTLDANGNPVTSPYRITSIEEDSLLKELEQLGQAPAAAPVGEAATAPQGPNAETVTARLVAAQQAVTGALIEFHSREALAVNAALELRDIPEEQRTLFTAVAKAAQGIREYTAQEAQALTKLSGASKVRFTPAPSPSPVRINSLSALPSVTEITGGRMLLDTQTAPIVPDALLAQIAQHAPSLHEMIATGGSREMATQAEAQRQASQTTASQATAKSPEQTARDVIADVIKRSPKLKGVIEVVESNGQVNSGGAWFTPTLRNLSNDPAFQGGGKIQINLPSFTAQLNNIDPALWEKRLASIIDEEVRHFANEVVTLRLFDTKLNELSQTMQAMLGRWEQGQKLHELAIIELKRVFPGIMDRLSKIEAEIEEASKNGKRKPARSVFQAFTETYHEAIWESLSDTQKAKVEEAYGSTFANLPTHIKAEEALRMIDQVATVGTITEAVLRHLAEVLKVLQELVTKPTEVIQRQIDGIKAVLTEYGYNVADTLEARQQASDTDTSAQIIGAQVIPAPNATRQTPDGKINIEVAEAALDHSQLVTSDDARFPKALQPRDRTLEASKKDRAEMVTNLRNNPDQWKRYYEGSTTDTGRIIVIPLMENGQQVMENGKPMFVVISGNGRAMALKAAAEAGVDASYQAGIRAALDEEGTSTAGMALPVAVAMWQPQTVQEAIALATASNIKGSGGTTMSAPELAGIGAKAIQSQGLLEKWAPDESGNALAESNWNFMRALSEAMGGIGWDATNNRPSASEAPALARNAMLALLLGNSTEGKAALRLAIDSADLLGITRQLDGIAAEAGSLLKLAQAKPQYDLVAELSEAIQALIEMKQTGSTGAETQLDAFRSAPSATATSFARALMATKSAKAVREMLAAYRTAAEAVDSSTGDMFGATPPTKAELIDLALDARPIAQIIADFVAEVGSEEHPTAQKFKAGLNALNAMPPAQRHIFAQALEMEAERHKAGVLTALEYQKPLNGQLDPLAAGVQRWIDSFTPAEAPQYWQRLMQIAPKGQNAAQAIRAEMTGQVTPSAPSVTFRYEMRARPPSIGTHPTEGLIRHTDGGTRHGFLEYSRELTTDEVYNFELKPESQPKVTKTQSDLFTDQPIEAGKLFGRHEKIKAEVVTKIKYLEAIAADKTKEAKTRQGARLAARRLSKDIAAGQGLLFTPEEMSGEVNALLTKLDAWTVTAKESRKRKGKDTQTGDLFTAKTDLRQLPKAELKAWAAAQPEATLPDNPNDYFITDDARILPVSALRPTKAPESQPASVRNAIAFAQAASEGRLDKRQPISVKDNGDGTFTVLDGNATYGMAVRSGWKNLPVKVLSPLEAALLEAKEAGQSYPHQIDGTFRSNWKINGTGRRVKLKDGSIRTVTAVQDKTLVLDDGTRTTAKEVMAELTPEELELEPYFITRLTTYAGMLTGFNEKLRSIAKGLPEAYGITAPLKGAPRALEKAGQTLRIERAKFEQGQIEAPPVPEAIIAGMADILRGSILVDSQDQVLDANAAILEMFAKSASLVETRRNGDQVWRAPGIEIILGDRFQRPTAAGYSDVQMRIEVAPGHFTEMQVHIPEMLAAKEGNGVKEMADVPEKYWPENLAIRGLDAARPGHKLYEVYRVFDEDSTDPRKIALEREMAQLYASAIEAHSARIAANATSRGTALTKGSSPVSSGTPGTSPLPLGPSTQNLPPSITTGSPPSSRKNLALGPNSGVAFTSELSLETPENQDQSWQTPSVEQANAWIGLPVRQKSTGRPLGKVKKVTTGQNGTIVSVTNPKGKYSLNGIEVFAANPNTTTNESPGLRQPEQLPRGPQAAVTPQSVPPAESPGTTDVESSPEGNGRTGVGQRGSAGSSGSGRRDPGLSGRDGGLAPLERPAGMGNTSADSSANQPGESDAVRPGQDQRSADDSAAGNPVGGAGRRSERSDARGRDGDREALPGSSNPGSMAGVGSRRQRPLVGTPERNFQITDDTILAEGGTITRLRNNISAIKLLRTLQKEKRNATQAEKETLAKYVGWGAIPQVFDDENARAYRAGDHETRRRTADTYSRYGDQYTSPGGLVDDYRAQADAIEKWQEKWGAYHAEIKALLTPEEYETAKESTLNAHYTAPEFIRSMWNMVQKMGFKGGTVLEPAGGIGHFYGLMPESVADFSNLLGVELDTISGGIMQKLYPESDIQITGIQDADIANGSVDLAISNVPFGAYGVYDPQIQAQGGPTNPIHNYFFAKALQKVKPGGLIAFITSSHTLDSNIAQREWLAERADLVTSFRLPNNAFKVNAGTEVVTDIIFLRKKDGSNFEGKPWKGLADVQTADGKTARINEFYAANPSHILGTLAMDGTMYGGEEMTVHPKAGIPITTALIEAESKVPANVVNVTSAKEQVATSKESRGKKKGALIKLEDGTLTRAGGGIVSDKQKQVAQDFIALRDTLNELYRLEMSPESTDGQVESARAQLNRLYDSFVTRHGFLHKHGKALNTDPDYYRALGLEIETRPETLVGSIKAALTRKKLYKKADVFTRRVLTPKVEPTRADSVKDAMGISLGWRGRLDISFIASLVQQTPEAVEQELLGAGLVFRNPEDSQLETPETYLSGNVRKKLLVARLSAESNPAMSGNVAALEAVQPADLSWSDISYRLGSQWIPAQVYQDFANEIFSVSSVRVVHHKGNDSIQTHYQVFNDARKGVYMPPAMRETYATKRLTAIDILDKALEGQSPIVRDTTKTDKGTKSVINPKDTEEARQIYEKIRNKFKEWVNNNATVQSQLLGIYNESFNSHVSPVYDGQHLEMPWVANGYDLYPDKKNVVWRAIQEGNTLIAHGVGGGKTIIGTAIAMEMKRLGLAKKPLIMVHNATLEQFAATIRQMAPTARVLVASKKDLEGPKRKEFMGRIASGDWDAVIMAHSTFNQIPDDVIYERKLMNEMLDQLDDAIRAEGGTPTDDVRKVKNPTVKELIKTRNNLKVKVTKLQDRKKDDTLNFQELGIDTIILDEAHLYKKIPFVTTLTRIAGIDNGASERGTALLLRTRYIQETNNGRGVFTMTGTPVTNTLGEAWNMVRMVRPNLLKEFGVESFDAFVSTFASIENSNELRANGAYKSISRLSQIDNLPEWNRFFRLVADVKMGNDMVVKGRPEIKGGKPELVAVERTSHVTRYVQKIKETIDWYDKLQGREKREYSHIPLVTYNAAKLAAIDMRLINPALADEAGSKVNTMLKKVMELYQRTNSYNGTQVIFADNFNPLNSSELKMSAEDMDAQESISDDVIEGFNLYSDIKKKLIAQGVPADQIATVHEIKNEDARERMFEKINDGRIRIVIGSTQRLGTGVNMQRLMIAAHHLDVPWTPAELEQRDGRVYRQGNIHGEMGIPVEIYRYGMKDTLDAALWQKLETKERFIKQALSGKLSSRSIEDDTGLVSLSEQKAILTGPLGMRKFELESALREIVNEREAWKNRTYNARQNVNRYRNTMVDEGRLIPAARGRWMMVRDAWQDMETRGPVIEIAGTKYEGHAKASEALKAIWDERSAYLASIANPETATKGREPLAKIIVNGIPVTLTAGKIRPGMSIETPWVFDSTAELEDGYSLGSGSSPGWIMRRLYDGHSLMQNNLGVLESSVARADGFIETAQAEADVLFTRDAEFIQLQKELEAVMKKLEATPGTTPDMLESEFLSRPRFEQPVGREVIPSAPAPAQSDALQTALSSMPPIWRSVLQASMRGDALPVIAAREKLSETAIGNILRVSNGRLNVLLKAQGGALRPTVQMVDGAAQASRGRPDLALGAMPAVVAVDQTRAGPEEVTHAEMQDLANRMLTEYPAEAEALVMRWMDSGTVVVDTANAPRGLKAIVNEAQARQAAQMLMTAAAKLLTVKKALEGGDMVQMARFIDTYRNTGTEQARALGMRRDPFQSPAERHAMFIAEAMLTPPEAVRNEIRRNPGNRDSLLAKWAAVAQDIKAKLKAKGIDIDAAFKALAEEQAATPPQVRMQLTKADAKTRAVVQAILAGKTPTEAAGMAGVSLAEAKRLYIAFRESVNKAGIKAAEQARDEMLIASAPAQDYAAQVGLPDADIFNDPDKPAPRRRRTTDASIRTEGTEIAGNLDLNDPVQVAGLIRDFALHKATALDMTLEFWRASILSGPQTHVVNIVSGAAFGAYEATVKKLGSAAAADMARMFGMQPDAASLSDLPAMLAAVMPSIKEAFSQSLRAWRMESRVFEPLATAEHSQFAFGGGKYEQFAPALPGIVGKVMRGISFRAMLAADELVKGFFGRLEVVAQARQIARAERLTGTALADRIAELMQPGSKAWLRALEHAKKVTFQTDIGSGERSIDAIDAAAKVLKDARSGRYGSTLKGIGTFVLPFIDTPTNIFKQGITMTPLGTFLAIMDGARALNESRKGNKEQAAKLYNAARFLDDLVNQTIAWSAVIVLSELIEPGDDEDELPFITGTMPWKSTQPGERDLANRAAPPQSIRIAGTWYSYRRLDPFASMLAMTVDALKAAQSGQGWEQASGQAAGQVFANLQDKTFLSGISDLMAAINAPEQKAVDYAFRLATGFVPNLIKQPIRAADNLVRDAKPSPDIGFVDGMAQKLGYSVMPQMAPPKMDIWGRPVDKNTGTGAPSTDFLVRLFSPMQTVEGSGVDPLDIALMRFNLAANTSGAKPFSVTPPDRNITRSGIKVTLPDAAYNDFLAKAGKTARQLIGDRYNGRDLTEQDVDWVKEVISKTHSAFRDSAWQKYRSQ